MSEAIPTEILLRLSEERLRNICMAPLMYGGTWDGVEIEVQNALELRELALSWPNKTPIRVGLLWCGCSNRIYPATGNTGITFALRRDGITDEEVLRAKLTETIQLFLEDAP